MTIVDLEAKLDAARRQLFDGQLPESLERVAEVYLGLARERVAKGQSIEGIGVALDMAINNAAELE